MTERTRRTTWARRRGAMIVLVLITLVVFIATMALSIDIAYIQLTRTELRMATDAAARAGAEALSRDRTEAEARQAAKDIAAANRVAGRNLILEDGDIVLGSSQLQADGSWDFTAGATPINAVRVLGRRTEDSPSGKVNLFFGGMLGRESIEPTQSAIAAQLDRDICLVLDRSGSMAWDLSGTDWSYPGTLSYPSAYCQAPHATGSRWAAAASAVDVFLDEVAVTVQDEQISFVTYASAGLWCSGRYNASDIEIGLTPDYQLVRAAVANVTSNPIPGGTDIGAGIESGTVALTDPTLARRHALKTMVVMTDGQWTNGDDPVIAATNAAAQRIQVHAITFSGGADQVKMQAVATAGNGNHYHAPDAAALRAVFREIASTLPVVLTE